MKHLDLPKISNLDLRPPLHDPWEFPQLSRRMQIFLSGGDWERAYSPGDVCVKYKTFAVHTTGTMTGNMLNSWVN